MLVHADTACLLYNCVLYVLCWSRTPSTTRPGWFWSRSMTPTGGRKDSQRKSSLWVYVAQQDLQLKLTHIIICTVQYTARFLYLITFQRIHRQMHKMMFKLIQVEHQLRLLYFILVNNLFCLCCFQVTHIKAPKTAEDEFIEIQSATGTAVQRWAVRSLTLCKLVRAITPASAPFPLI